LLSFREIGSFYLDVPLIIPEAWSLRRKHFRVSLKDGRFVKLNRFANRLKDNFVEAAQ
jgi:hypothetical protein